MRIKLIAVTKKFISLRGIVTAVDGIDLEIGDREFFVLLGPSGCGKSTILNLIAGLEKATEGEIWFDERIVFSSCRRIFLTPRERNVAFVFQSYALYPHLSVFENIAFPLRAVGESQDKIRQSVEHVADMLKISEFISVRPGELSGGERQRVAIARAIVRHPNIFLLDEPLSNLDAQLRASTRDELKRLQRALGVTTVYVTHDQIEALTLGDRVALLKDGRVEQIGTPQELYEKPCSIFAARFVGSPPMNIFNVSFTQEGDIFYIIIGGRKFRVPMDMAEKLKKFKDNSCIFGIRPEDIYINHRESSQPFKAKIDLIEPLGRERLIHISIGGYRFSGLTTDIRLREGDMVEVEFNMKKAHVFEEEGG